MIYLYSVPIIATLFFPSGKRAATILAAFALWGATSDAFMVTSESALILFLQTPGSGEAFYREASEPCLLPCTVSEKEFSETEPRYTPRYCPPRGGAVGS